MLANNMLAVLRAACTALTEAQGIDFSGRGFVWTPPALHTASTTSRSLKAKLETMLKPMCSQMYAGPWTLSNEPRSCMMKRFVAYVTVYGTTSAARCEAEELHNAAVS